MKWSPQQDAALRAVAQWLRDPKQPVFRLFGYAGTGKTTLAKHFAAGIDGDVAFAAFTGKAALVLRQSGCEGATTIHNLIYTFLGQDKEGKLQFARANRSRADGAKLIIIDECSMVDAAMGCDLLSFGVPVLVLGDPAQLPPIDGGGFFTDAQPDVMLTDIRRQARDNPIIDLATTVREGGELAEGHYGASRVINISKLDDAEPDQILVGLNRTRMMINSGVRGRLKLYGTNPVVGDKLVCLRNDHKRGLLNGSLWQVSTVTRRGDELVLTLVGDDGEKRVTTHCAFFDGLTELPQRHGYTELDYGYALTVHKAQGSQWGTVLLHDQSVRFNEQAARWLYTGITRAVQAVTVVRR